MGAQQMGITGYMLTSLIAISGLGFGFLLAWITKEELKKGEAYFVWMQHIFLILIINMFFYYVVPNIITSLLLLAFSSALIIKFKPRAIVGYILSFVFSYLGFKSNVMFVLLSSLIFLYGFPTAALIRIEGSKEIKDPLRLNGMGVRIIGHRGALHHEPENTLISFERAIQMGAGIIEADARMTKDGHIVCMHDPTINRTTNGKGLVNNKTLKEIKALKIKHAGKITNENVPALDDVLRIARRRCGVNVHIKEHESLGEVIKIIRKNRMRRKTTISSFSEHTLMSAKELAPRVKRAYLFSIPTPYYLDIAKRLKLYALHPHYTLLTERFVRRAHKNRIKINAWGIRSKKAALDAIRYNVDGLITDDPLLYEKK